MSESSYLKDWNDPLGCQDVSLAQSVIWELQATIDKQKADIAELAKGIKAVQELIDESDGVYGLHLNGDPADWNELQVGGRYEEWLIDFNDCAKHTQGEE